MPEQFHIVSEDRYNNLAAAGGLHFSKAEMDAFNELAAEARQPL